MVGIYSKIKNFFSDLGDKAKSVAFEYVAPVVGKLGNIAGSEFVQGLATKAAPYLNGVIPGLGTGIQTALPWAKQIGDVANGAYKNYMQNPNYGFGDLINNVRNKKYGSKVPKGIGLARRPDELHSRIELKALPSPDDMPESFVEELD
jgi:hypothetical protein